MLIPSTITARRTRRYTSTLYIRRTIHGVGYNPMDDGGRYSIKSPILSNLPPTRPTLTPPFTLLSGIAGTLPNTTYSSSISLTEVTGVAARRVGGDHRRYDDGAGLLSEGGGAAHRHTRPGDSGARHSLPGDPVRTGMRIVIADGMDHRKATIAGVTFWVGVGFQNGWIFADKLGDGFFAGLLGNRMTAGAIVAVLMMLFMELTTRRNRRLTVPLKNESLPEVDKFARRADWNEPSTERLASAGEETLGRCCCRSIANPTLRCACPSPSAWRTKPPSWSS